VKKRGAAMDWLLKFVVLWLSIDVVIIATAWYAATLIKPQWPNWWRRVVVDEDPTNRVVSWRPDQASTPTNFKETVIITTPTKIGDLGSKPRE